jgi:hypothetical protein
MEQLGEKKMVVKRSAILFAHSKFYLSIKYPCEDADMQVEDTENLKYEEKVRELETQIWESLVYQSY